MQILQIRREQPLWAAKDQQWQRSYAQWWQNKVLQKWTTHLPLSWNFHIQWIHCSSCWLCCQDQPCCPTWQSLCCQLRILHRFVIYLLISTSDFLLSFLTLFFALGNHIKLLFKLIMLTKCCQQNNVEFVNVCQFCTCRFWCYCQCCKTEA